MKYFIFLILASYVITLCSLNCQAQVTMWGRIDSTTIVNGQECYVFNYGIGNDLIGINYLLEENGYVRLYAEWHYQLGFHLYDNVSSYFIKQNPQVGDFWYGGGVDYPIKFTVIGTEIITVPAGTFLTYKVEARDTSTTNLDKVNYFADSIGEVRSLSYESDFEMVLASYTVQGGGCFPLAIGNEWLNYFLSPISVEDYNNDCPKNFNLWNAYPNPFNPSTKIKYQIPESNFVILKVYDVLGNEVATLVNEEKPAGEYEVEFNGHSDEGQNLSSGVYFYQLRIRGPETSSGQGMIQTKKMVLVK